MARRIKRLEPSIKALSALAMANIEPELPKVWQRTRLGDLLREVDARAGSLPPTEAAELEVLSLTKNDGLIPQRERFGKRIATVDIRKYKVVREGQIVYNPYVIWEGAVHGLRNLKAGIVSPVYPVYELREPDGGYLDLLLRTPPLIEAYNRLCSGAVNRRRSIREEAFVGIEVVVPPLAERRTIATILQTVQRAKEACEKVIAAMRELKQSLLHHLFTYGPVSFEQAHKVRLKETEVGLMPEHWQLTQLKAALREPLRNGHSAKISDTNNGIRTLTLTAVTQNTFSLKNTKLTCANPERVQNIWLKRGDIFIERANTPEYVGLAALYEGEDDFAIFPDLLVRVRVHEDRFIPKFLVEFLLLPATRRYFRMRAKKTAGNFPKIDQGIIENTIIPAIPISEQQRIAAMLSAVDRKLAAEKSRHAALTNLFQSLLHHLMTGKVRLPDFAKSTA